MNWQKFIDITTFNNAWLTYKTHFKGKYGNISFRDFYDKTLKSKYYSYSIKELKKINPKNINWNRLTNNKRLEDAYPDAPRGNFDLESLIYLTTTKDSISPIIILKYKNTYIKLDGVHRVIAANYMNSKIMCCIIDSEN